MAELEDRRVLTANLYVDFGTLLGSQTLAETTQAGTTGWSTLGQAAPTNGGVNWVFGPEFPYAGNPQITYTPFGTVVNNAVSRGFTFDPGPDPANDPFEFETGPELPIDTTAALETSVMQELTRMYAPFDIQVEQVNETSLDNAAPPARR